jgi:hypothetical protein
MAKERVRPVPANQKTAEIGGFRCAGLLIGFSRRRADPFLGWQKVQV